MTLKQCFLILVIYRTHSIFSLGYYTFPFVTYCVFVVITREV